jgi:hypothetical protein
MIKPTSHLPRVLTIVLATSTFFSASIVASSFSGGLMPGGFYDGIPSGGYHNIRPSEGSLRLSGCSQEWLNGTYNAQSATINISPVAEKDNTEILIGFQRNGEQQGVVLQSTGTRTAGAKVRFIGSTHVQDFDSDGTSRVTIDYNSSSKVISVDMTFSGRGKQGGCTFDGSMKAAGTGS